MSDPNEVPQTPAPAPSQEQSVPLSRFQEQNQQLQQMRTELEAMREWRQSVEQQFQSPEPQYDPSQFQAEPQTDPFAEVVRETLQKDPVYQEAARIVARERFQNTTGQYVEAAQPILAERPDLTANPAAPEGIVAYANLLATKDQLAGRIGQQLTPAQSQEYLRRAANDLYPKPEPAAPAPEPNPFAAYGQPAPQPPPVTPGAPAGGSHPVPLTAADPNVPFPERLKREREQQAAADLSNWYERTGWLRTAS